MTITCCASYQGDMAVGQAVCYRQASSSATYCSWQSQVTVWTSLAGCIAPTDPEPRKTVTAAISALSAAIRPSRKFGHRQQYRRSGQSEVSRDLFAARCQAATLGFPLITEREAPLRRMRIAPKNAKTSLNRRCLNRHSPQSLPRGGMRIKSLQAHCIFNVTQLPY